MSKFINIELKSDSDSDSSDLDLDSVKIGAKVYNKLMTKNQKNLEVKHKTPLGESGYLSIYFFKFFCFLFFIFYLFLMFFFLVHSSSYLGRWRISLGVAIILSICLHSHTQLDCNQFAIILGSYLYTSILQKVLIAVETLINFFFFFRVSF